MRIEPSSCAEARQGRGVGAQATEYAIPPSGSNGGEIGDVLADGLQSLIVPSKDDDATRLPSGDHETSMTRLRCPPGRLAVRSTPSLAFLMPPKIRIQQI